MKLAFLHPDDYDKALSNGCRPFVMGDPVPVDELRVCTDSYYNVEKGECEMWTLPNIDRMVDAWYESAPLFPGDEPGCLWRDIPHPFVRKAKS